MITSGSHPRPRNTAMHRRALVTVLLLAAAPLRAQSAAPVTHRIMPSPSTVAWGYYDAAAKPVLTIASGDRIVVGTLITSSPSRLEGAGVRPAEVEKSLRDITDSVTNKGPGGHILTGPIYVRARTPATSSKCGSRRSISRFLTPTTRSVQRAAFCPRTSATRRCASFRSTRSGWSRTFAAGHRDPAPPVLRQHGRGAAARRWGG